MDEKINIENIKDKNKAKGIHILINILSNY
jgi:hypothetical protein